MDGQIAWGMAQAVIAFVSSVLTFVRTYRRRSRLAGVVLQRVLSALSGLLAEDGLPQKEQVAWLIEVLARQEGVPPASMPGPDEVLRMLWAKVQCEPLVAAGPRRQFADLIEKRLGELSPLTAVERHGLAGNPTVLGALAALAVGGTVLLLTNLIPVDLVSRVNEDILWGIVVGGMVLGLAAVLSLLLRAGPLGPRGVSSRTGTPSS